MPTRLSILVNTFQNVKSLQPHPRPPYSLRTLQEARCPQVYGVRFGLEMPRGKSLMMFLNRVPLIGRPAISWPS